MTDFQKAQLLHLLLTGDFKYRNRQGHKAPRQAWLKMIDTLLDFGFINARCRVTEQGKAYLDANHQHISLTVLD